MIKEPIDPAALHDLWDRALVFIREKMSPQTYEAMFGQTRIHAYNPDNQTVTIMAPDIFTQNYLSHHYVPVIENALLALTNTTYGIDFVCEKKETPPSPSTASTEWKAPVVASGSNDYEPLIDRYNFDSFVIGHSNRFAHAACLAVAEKPGQNYNPLFIYGGVGLGKTHLMHAIGHAVRHRFPAMRVAYLSTERFINEFIMSIRENSAEEFRNRYRSIDLLLIDDIQFIARKEQTQEEFFHTFNALHQTARQIVISSDRPPREIPTLEDRLRSRFEWGLLTDIQPPDLETRIAILQRKAKSDGLILPEDVYYFIANQIDSNIRELEGALIRVIAYSSLVNEEVNVQLAEEALKDIVMPSAKRTITVSHIQKVIGDHYGVKLDELKAKNRTRSVAFARQVAMYLSRELTDLSLPKIGEAFGGRDHTTVMHAYDKISDEANRDQNFRSTLTRLTEAIRTLY